MNGAATAEAEVALGLTDVDRVEIIAILGRLDAATRAKSKGDPLDMAVSNVLRSHPCYVDLNQWLGRVAGPNLERRKEALKLGLEAFYRSS